MLVTLGHLLVVVLLLSGGPILGLAAAKSAGAGEGAAIAATVASALLVPLVLGWPLFKLLSLRPLILPMCSSCGRRHGNYHLSRDAWPVAVILCAHCSKPLRLVLNGKAVPLEPPGLPTVTLRWPGFLGLWRRVPPQDP